MQKALITFVVLAIILVVFFVLLEFMGDSSASASFGEAKAMAETTADFLKPAA